MVARGNTDSDLDFLISEEGDKNMNFLKKSAQLSRFLKLNSLIRSYFRTTYA